MDIETSITKFKEKPAESEAWDAIVSWAYKPLLAYVAVLLVDFKLDPSLTANDVVHDVLLKFLERPDRIPRDLKSSGQIISYLKHSCKNHLIDKYRHIQTARQFVNYLGLTFDEAFPAHNDFFRHIFIKEIIEQMGGECGELLQQYITQDATLADMAESRGWTAPSFNAKWYRCLEKAKKIFSEKKGRSQTL